MASLRKLQEHIINRQPDKSITVFIDFTKSQRELVNDYFGGVITLVQFLS